MEALLIAVPVALVALALVALYATRATDLYTRAARDYAAALEALARVTRERDAARADCALAQSERKAAEAALRASADGLASERQHADFISAIASRLRASLTDANLALHAASGALHRASDRAVSNADADAGAEYSRAMTAAGEAAVRTGHALRRSENTLPSGGAK